MPSLIENLLNVAWPHPERVAIRYEQTVLTYAELEDRTARVARLLRERGIGSGDRVALMLPNVPEFVVLYYGILRAGAIVVPMNPLLKSREVAYYLSDSGARLLFEFTGGPGEGVRGATEAGAEVVEVEPGTFAALLATHEPDRTEPVHGEDGIAVILYTSGTTGAPKGAALTHDGLAHNAEVYATQVQDVGRDDVLLGCLPLFHTFGQTCAMNTAVCAGAALTLLSRFEPDAVFAAVRRDGVTMFAGVPTMYSALLHAPGAAAADMSSLRRCVSGGASLSAELLRAFEDFFGCVILEGYGLSETSPVVTFNHVGRVRKPGSIGTPIRDVEVALLDIADGIGEIAVRGPNVMRGYWGRPEATREAISEGWFRTGDLARRDEDGYYFIVDRKKDMIIRGGYNVYPREIEEVLHEHPGVAQAAVVAIPDDRLGEEVGAAIVLSPDSTATVAELRDFVRERVAAYKYPRRVWLMDALPTGPTGKILKRAITAPGPSRASDVQV
ncbi:long-chain-fatty-acid--CoA ligase [Nocardia wallacei]|uniref:long-chain-fatty-acid--CoA ligase n=1 Tax=Nocardia wallacei TaxID=480035 RepID=UPI002456F0D0|nr:long-chain fatty acid--CoA ligase [Nocardia wallacei]